jgi:hypothetical protein
MNERIENLRKLYPNIQDVINASKCTEEELAIANYSGNSNLLIGARAAIRRELVANVFNTRLDGTVWTADWNNDDEPKWFPVFNMQSKTPSGVGFSVSGYVLWVTTTRCGSRFAFEKEELSDLSAELYPELYVESLIKTK